MTPRRTITSRWRSLKTRVRRWIITGVLALLGICGAFVSDEIKTGLKASFTAATGYFGRKTCELGSPQKPRDPEKPVVLFAHLGNDPDDVTWNSIWVQLVDEAEFESTSSCLVFEIGKGGNLNQAKEDFLRKIKPHIDAAHADMLLFGIADIPYRARIWSATFLGGCDWQGEPLDVRTAPDQVLQKTRSALLRVIIEGLIAACNREPSDDWRGVARIVDVVVPYLEKKKSLLTPEDYRNAQLHVYGLAFSRYTKVGEEPWFERARNALNLLLADAAAAHDRGAQVAYHDQLAKLYWWKYRKANSADALAQFVDYVVDLSKNNPAAFNSLVSDFDSESKVVSGLQAALFANTLGIKKDDAVQALESSIEIALKQEPKNAEEFNDRCWIRAITERDLTLALVDCDQSLRLRPNDNSTLNSRAMVQYKLGDFDAAIVNYSAALNLEPKDAGSLFGRGMAKLKKGDFSGGNRDITNSKTIDPSIDAVYAGYGMR